MLPLGRLILIKLWHCLISGGDKCEGEKGFLFGAGILCSQHKHLYKKDLF